MKPIRFSIVQRYKSILKVEGFTSETIYLRNINNSKIKQVTYETFKNYKLCGRRKR